MNDQAVHRRAIDIDDRMQQPALLQAMVGNVLVLELQNGESRQQRIAVVGTWPDGIAAIGSLHLEHRGQRFVLAIEIELPLVATLNFLQEDQVRSQVVEPQAQGRDRKSTRLNSSHVKISYAVFCL